MKKTAKKSTFQAQVVVKKAEKSNQEFIELLKQKESIITAITTIKPEKGLRKFDI